MISPLSIWTWHETVICRLGVVRIRQMPGSRLSSFAASSNSVSIASKRLPVPPFGAIGDDSIVPGQSHAERPLAARARSDDLAIAENQVELQPVVRVPHVGPIGVRGTFREREGFVVRRAGGLLRRAPDVEDEERLVALLVADDDVAGLWSVSGHQCPTPC